MLRWAGLDVSGSKVISSTWALLVPGVVLSVNLRKCGGFSRFCPADLQEKRFLCLYSFTIVVFNFVGGGVANYSFLGLRVGMELISGVSL